MRVRRLTPYSTPKFNLKQCVRIAGGPEGKVVGATEYIYGWEYRIQIPGEKRTLVRREDELSRCGRKAAGTLE